MAGIDSNALFCAHFDEADGSTTLVDSSSSARVITCVGNAQSDTADQKFGAGSLLLDGTGDYISIPDSADWDFGTGDFTVDGWAKATGAGYFDLFSHGTATMGRIRCDGSADIQVQINGGFIIDLNNVVALSTGTWFHWAIERYSGTVNFFINGTSYGSAADTQNITGNTSAWFFGGNVTYLNGWMDEPRISNVGRYGGSNFTPPTAAYSGPVSKFSKMMLMGVS
jgi:hypothetical protein